MKTIAVIPARGGSKRLPDKNIRVLGELPLIAHSIRFAKETDGLIDEVFVSTDNERIKKIALDYGAKVIDRPANLSGDNEPTVTALKHVLEQINEAVENVVLLQPTNPLRPKGLLADVLGLYLKNNYDSIFTVTRNYQKFGKIVHDKFIPFNYEMGQRSQDLEPLYFENGLLYISKRELILQEKILGENHYPFVVNHPFAEVDIDTEADFEHAEYMLNKK